MIRDRAVPLLLTALLAGCAGAAGSGQVVTQPTPVPPPATAAPGSLGLCATEGVGCADLPTSSDPCPPGGCAVVEPTHVPVEVVETRGTPRAVPFESAEVGPDDRTVTVRWWSGVEPCTALADVRVEETAEAVEITLLEASVHPDAEPIACIEIAQAKQHAVQLAEPLAGRSIIDGAR